MRWQTILLCMGLALSSTAVAEDGKVLKVLPQFVDKQGRTALSPSLYDRDAYQAYLRRNPAKRSALRFAVEWKSNAPKTQELKLRVEMRGTVRSDAAPELKVELPVTQKNLFSHWASLNLSEADYQKLGEVTAWRVTLWDGDQLLSEQKSFLW